MPLVRSRRRRLGIDAALVVGSLVLAWFGQSLLRDHSTVPAEGSLLLLLAGFSFIGVAIRLEGPWTAPLTATAVSPRSLRALLRREPRRTWLVASSIAVTVALLWVLRGKRPTDSYWDGFLLWLLDAVLLIAAALPVGWPHHLWQAIQEQRHALSITIRITAIAALLRFVWLGAHPNVISGDEGRIAGLALAATRGELPNPFSTTFGHSVVYLHLMALPYHLIGVNPVAYRLLHAIAGSLTVGLTYLLGRRMFDARVGAIAAVLLGVSHMHLHFSRIAVAGGIMDAFLTTLAVFLFYGGLRRGQAWELVLSGIVVAFHLYVYMGGRLTALFLLPAIAVIAVFNWRLAWTMRLGIAGFVLALSLVGAPFAQWSITHPEQFFDRANQVGIFPTGWLANEVQSKGLTEVQVLARQVWNALLAFNHHQAVAFYNAELPALDFVTAIPATLGLAYALLRVREERFLLLNGWFWASVVVGQVLLVTPERNAYRILIVLPATMVLAAVGWMKLLGLAGQAIVPSWRAGMLLTLAFVAIAASNNIGYYFVRFLPSCRFEDPNTRRASILGQYLGTLPRTYIAYVYGPPHYVYGVHPSVDFLSRRLPAMNVEPAQAVGLAFLDQTLRPAFVYVPERRAESSVATEAFPNGTWRELQDCGRTVLHVYESSAT